MTATLIHQGRRLAPGETIVWQGSPSWMAVARHVFHLFWLAAYLVFLLALDAYQAWSKAIPPMQAAHDSVPLAVLSGLVLALFGSIAWLTGRTTRYTVTNRRVILDYGIALTATLSIPFSRVRTVGLRVHPDHTGDIPLRLHAEDHMPFLKLWPHARPFRLGHPEPMLRAIPSAAVVAGLLTRALLANQQHAMDRPASPGRIGQRATAIVSRRSTRAASCT